MNVRRVSGHAALAAVASLAPLSPALAARSIQIDAASNSNTLTSCTRPGAFANCLYLERSIGASVSGFEISQNGYIQLIDGRPGSANLFYVGKSDTVYTVLSGYTGFGEERIDTIDFYKPGSDLTVDPFTDNRAPADFQIQLRYVAGRSPGSTDLEVGFAYQDPSSLGGNHVPAGAMIGYSGTNFSQTGNTPDSTQRGPASRFITNSDRLLLGGQNTDSEFVFVVGDYQLVEDGVEQDTTLGLVSQTFTPRYGAADPSLPEPGTWGMMLLGFGVAGAALRRRGRIVATA